MADIDEGRLRELLQQMIDAVRASDEAADEARARGDKPDSAEQMQMIVMCCTQTGLLLGELMSGRCGTAQLIAYGAELVLAHGAEIDGQTEKVDALKPYIDTAIQIIVEAAGGPRSNVIPFRPRGGGTPSGDLN